MARLICGDSHARSFSLCVDKVYEYGGMTAHILGHFGVPNEMVAMPGDHVLFCFFEVDVRVHIPKLAEQSGIPINAMASQVVSRYIERIRTFCNHNQVKGHVIAAPPQAVPTTPDAVVPTVDTIQDRIARTNAVNQVLMKLCAPDIGFIDIWGPFRNEDGSLNMNLSDGIVHVASSQNELIRDLVVPHFTSR